MSDNLLSPEEIERKAAERGLSLPELCKIAGVSHSTFYRWKAGKNVPSIEVYRRLCQALLPNVA